MKSTREVSKNQEKKIVKAIGGKRTPNSGATAFIKGDILDENFLIEAKTCMEPKGSFSIKKEWLKKMKEEQFAMSKPYSALCFDFGDEKDRFYIIDEMLFNYIKEVISKDIG